MVARRRGEGSPRVAVAYVRVSTDRQELGPEAQRAAITTWAAREGVAIVAFHEERDVSGATPVEARPGFVAALETLSKAHAGLLVVYDRSRVARDTFEAIVAERAVERAGARIVSTSGAGNGTTDDDRMMRRIADAVAERERAAIRARTKAALAVKKARGERVSGIAPYGKSFGADGALVDNPAEQAVIQQARTFKAAGMTFRAVAEELEMLGMLNRKGRPFDAPAICRMLASEATAA